MARFIRPCAVRGCIPPDLKRFSFPRTLDKAEKWREVCANPKIKDIPVERLHTRCVVCRKHFTKDNYVNYLMERLNKGVIPSLFLPTADSLDTNPCNPSDSSEDASVPLHPVPERDVILPPVDLVSTHGSAVADDIGTCLDDCDDREGDFNEATPSSPSSVVPGAQVLPENKEGENPMLKLIVTEVKFPPINDYYRYTLCRLCFGTGDSLTNIFEEGHECGFVISDAIKDLLQFKVSKTDDYPQFICTGCLVKLREFKEYKDILCKHKEAFEKELQKLRKSDEDDIIRSQHDSLMEEDLENSMEADSAKHLSDVEEVAEEDVKAELSENGSESEEAITDYEDTAINELSEPETKTKSNSDMLEIVLQDEYKCHECGKVFKFINLLTSHMKEHRKTWPLPCQYCGKRFRTLMDLNNHIIMHSDYKPFECEHCGLRCRTKTTLYRHKVTHTNDKPFLCSTCGVSFRDRLNLRNHLRMHSNIKCYKCEQCGREFRTGGKLSNHYVSHMTDRPYTCGECGKSFRKGTSLSWHITCVHSGEKQFQCEFCQKSFSLRKYLNSHMKIHSRHLL